MEFAELVKQRRSIRKFKPDSISAETLKEIIEVTAYPAQKRLVVRPRSIACHSGNYNYRKYWL